MFWLPTVSVGDPAVKRQLPFGSSAISGVRRRENCLLFVSTTR